MQTLMFPVTIEVSSLQLITIKELQNELSIMGFDFEISESETAHKIIISAEPSNVNIGSVELAFIEIIDDYISNEELKGIPKQDRIIATIACKSAIKAGQKLTEEDMQSIVNGLLQCQMQYVCPHGRPIIVHFPIAE